MRWQHLTLMTYFLLCTYLPRGAERHAMGPQTRSGHLDVLAFRPDDQCDHATCIHSHAWAWYAWAWYAWACAFRPDDECDHATCAKWSLLAVGRSSHRPSQTPPNAFNVHVLSFQSSVFSVQRTDHDKRHPVVPNHALCIVPGVDSWVGVAGHLLLASIAHDQTLAFFEDRHPLLLRSGAVVDVCNTTIHQPQHLRSVVSVRCSDFKAQALSDLPSATAPAGETNIT